ncbi:unannotated protein [freshwater metagenome]|uniref:Unannotated protein n=1 Tax=freshwater metagenome TaxID=449393 RepID=A0A6J6L6S3_9ZZZZ|nr:hypothetical protein [Actinomycetota bacterium]
MRKKLIALLSIFALLLAPTLVRASAADFIDDQFYELPLPANEAGYLGARVDDSVSFTFSSFLIANDDEGIKNGLGVPCADFKDAECSKYPRFTYNIYLPPCSVAITDDCITAITATKSDGTVVPGKLTGTKPNYSTPAFKGDPAFNMPDGWYPSMWSFDGIKHPGGDGFLLRASLLSFQNKRSIGVITPQLRVSVSAVTWNPVDISGNWSKETNGVSRDTGLMSAGGASSPTCNFFLAVKECATAWSLPSDVRFKVELKTRAKVSGWVNGRLSDPKVEVTPNGTGQAFAIEAAPMQVPIFAMYKKFTEYSKEFQDFNQRVGGGAGRIMFPESNWRSVYSGSGREPFDKISAFHALNTYDQQAFTEFQYFLAASDNKAVATKNLWHFESNRLFYQDGDLKLNDCSRDLTGLAGFVSTNSTMFMATPPKFNTATQSLDYQVAAPHFDRNGKENIGRYNLVIDSNVARCLYKFSTAPIQASVTVINADGTQQISTSTINEKNGWLYLSVNGYTYSAPTLKVKLSQEAPTPTPSATPSAEATPIAAQVLPPVMVNPLKAKTISVKLGKVVVFTVTDPAIWKGKVADSKIAKFVAGGPKSTYETNPSLTLLKKGKTTVSLTDGKKTYLLKLTVS